jgi:hypothetical protein
VAGLIGICCNLLGYSYIYGDSDPETDFENPITKADKNLKISFTENSL